MALQAIDLVTLLVHDYDEARRWFCDVLGFEVVEDTSLAGGKRWLVVAPPAGTGARLLLARAADERQAANVGNQAGGRVSFFLATDDFAADFGALRQRGVKFAEAPRQESYGTVVVFADLYGNRWDLIESK